MSECQFCRDFKTIREDNRKSSARINADPDIKFRVRRIMTLRIRIDTYRSGSGFHGHAGTLTVGRYPVHYCPVCGKRIARDRIK